MNKDKELENEKCPICGGDMVDAIDENTGEIIAKDGEKILDCVKCGFGMTFSDTENQPLQEDIS